MRVLALAEETLVAGGNIARGGAGWNSASGTFAGGSGGSSSGGTGSSGTRCSISSTLESNESTTFTLNCNVGGTNVSFTYNTGVAAACFITGTGAAGMASPLGPLAAAGVGLGVGAVCNRAGGNGISIGGN